MLKNGLYKKKLIPQFVCTYYLGLLAKVHTTILSIAIVDTKAVERTHKIEPKQKLTPGLHSVGRNRQASSLLQ